VNQEKNVLSFIFINLDTLYYFKDEDVNDYSKRVISRYFFILIDDLLKVAGKTNNKQLAAGKITSSDRTETKEKIRALRKSYENAYDLIRDKLSAHQQNLKIDLLYNYWLEIDVTTVETLYGEACDIKDSLQKGFDTKFDQLKQYSKMNIISPELNINADKNFNYSSDRLSIAKSNTIGIIPAHDSQDRAQTVISILNFLKIDFALTVQCNNPKTDYQSKLFDIGWLLVICDFISLIDNLYEDNVYGKSILTYWTELNMEGHSILDNSNKNKRDLNYENKIRNIRNKIAAHKDNTESIQSVYDIYQKIDLGEFHKYITFHCNVFIAACRLDIRTKLFNVHNSPVYNVTKLSSPPIRPFDN